MTLQEITTELLTEFPTKQREIARYVSFIHHLKSSTPEIYHRHHILPRALYPQYSNLSENRWNSISVSLHAHYLCHWMLAKIDGGKMYSAFIRQSTDHNGNRVGGVLYADGLKHMSEYMKELKTGTKVFTDGSKNIVLQPNDIPPEGYYPGKTLRHDYVAGPLGKVAINKGGLIKYVLPDDVLSYKTNGWVLGTGKFIKKNTKNFWYKNTTTKKNWRGELGKQPPGFVRGRLLSGNFTGPSTHNRGKIIINDGNVIKYVNNDDTIPDGWERGRLKKH